MAEKNSKPAASKDQQASTSDTADEKRVDYENRVRSAPVGEGTVSVETTETDGKLYDPKDDPSPKEDKEHGIFRRDFVLQPDQTMTDCANAVVQEACNFGYRPTGLASVEGSKPHADGYHVVVTWALPVSDQKRTEG